MGYRVCQLILCHNIIMIIGEWPNSLNQRPPKLNFGLSTKYESFLSLYLLFLRFSIVMNLTEKNWSMSLLKPQTKVGLSLKMCAPYRLRSKTRMTTNQFLTGVNMMNLLHKTRLLARKSCVYQQLMLTRVKIRKSAMIYQPPEFQVC